MRNMMHGCGVKLWRQTYNDSIQALEGKFFADDYMGPVMPCNKDDCFDSAVEADVAASHARSFLTGARQRQRGAAKQANLSSSAAARTHPTEPDKAAPAAAPAVDQQAPKLTGHDADRLAAFMQRFMSAEVSKLAHTQQSSARKP
eukprot:jgi/Chrzof1/9829/Cz04g17190.t1